MIKNKLSIIVTGHCYANKSDVVVNNEWLDSYFVYIIYRVRLGRVIVCTILHDEGIFVQAQLSFISFIISLSLVLRPHLTSLSVLLSQI